MLNGRAYQSARNMLISFQSRLSRLHSLYELLLEREASAGCGGQNYGGGRPSTGTHSDPVACRYARLETLRNVISRAEKLILPACCVRNEVKNSGREDEREMFLILERHFIAGESIKAVSGALGKSLRTMHRRKNELIERTAERIIMYQERAC